MPEPILTVDNLTRAPGLAGASLALARGEILGLAGASGAGKSTLARCLVRLIEPDAGTITLDGQDLRAAAGATLRALRRRIQLVFQDPLAALNPRSTIHHLLDTPLRLHAIPDRDARIADLLARFDLPAAILPRHPHEISGGQRQRVAIARALAISPDVLILDEPVSALDVAVRNRILNLLLDHHDRHGTSMLLVSHDLALLHAVAHRVAVMDQGRIVETYRPGEPPAHPASLRLLAATPTLR